MILKIWNEILNFVTLYANKMLIFYDKVTSVLKRFSKKKIKVVNRSWIETIQMTFPLVWLKHVRAISCLTLTNADITSLILKYIYKTRIFVKPIYGIRYFRHCRGKSNFSLRHPGLELRFSTKADPRPETIVDNESEILVFIPLF